VMDAEKNKNWSRMLKYINIEEFINSFSDFVKLYSRAGSFEKKEIEDKFSRFLSRERPDYILDFKITGEEIDSNGKFAHVNVIVDRFGVRITERYLYRFVLEKKEKLWLINSLEASVMKGIKR